jgi:hypothetical protein
MAGPQVGPYLPRRFRPAWAAAAALALLVAAGAVAGACGSGTLASHERQGTTVGPPITRPAAEATTTPPPPSTGPSTSSTVASTTSSSAPATTSSPAATTSTVAATTSGTTPTEKLAQPPAPVGCLAPRQPASAPPGGWLPTTSGATDYELEDAGSQAATTPAAEALAARFAADLGASGTTAAAGDFATASCTVDYDLLVRWASGAFGFARIVQLAAPVNLDSFALVGATVTSVGSGEVAAYQSVTGDGSTDVEVAVRNDGLLVYLQVISATGSNLSGWPSTTTSTTTTSVPPQPAPASPATVNATALDLLRDVAGS